MRAAAVEKSRDPALGAGKRHKGCRWWL